MQTKTKIRTRTFDVCVLYVINYLCGAFGKVSDSDSIILVLVWN